MKKLLKGCDSYFEVNIFKLDTYETTIGWEHWPDTHEFITQSAKFWNRGIRLSCYYNRI